jgi:predicted membrane chloride channel (bestrophin family)
LEGTSTGETMRNPLLFTLLLGVGIATEAATGSFEPTKVTKAIVTKSPKHQLSKIESVKGGSDSPAAAVAPAGQEEMREGIYWRRPSADAGIRYSSNDWLVNFITAPLSFTLRRISFHLLTNIVVSLIAIHLHTKYGQKVSIPMIGHNLLGSSLGLLLSYRTNSAYGRFWEARGYWTSTKGACRNLALLMKTHIGVHSPKGAQKFLNQLSAFPGTLMFLCLGGAAKLPDYAGKHLPGRPEGYVEEPSLPAILLLVELQKTLHQCKTESRSSKSDFVEAAHLSAGAHLVDKLMENVANCEKILRTPVPWTYSRHTSRFLTLWLGTLPFTLVGTMKPWLVIAIVIAVSYCMLGIEEIAHMIEQPFLGDPIDGDEKIWSNLDEDGEASALIKRGRVTQPYDIGIPVCSLAAQIRQEVQALAALRIKGH